ncbi:MAG: S9 family peptidase [Caulobacter sp.]|nr:S9 family peptidase [Caulobacter sp.]
MLKSLLAAGAACLALTCAASASAQSTPLSVYGGLPKLEDVQISPDGKLLAIMLTDGDKRMLGIRESAEGGKTLSLFNAGDQKLRAVQWAGNDHVLTTLSVTTQVLGLKGPKREYWMSQDINLATRKVTALMRDQPESMNVVLALPVVRIIDGVPFAFVEGVRFYDHQGWDVLFRINLKTGATRLLDKGASENTDGWLVSPEGEPVAQSVYDQEQGLWSLKVHTDKGWETIEKVTSKMGSHGLRGFGRDGRSVLVWMDDEHTDKSVLTEYAQDGTHAVVPGSADYDSVLRSPDGSRMIGGYALVGDERRYTFFDPKLQAAWKGTIKAFPGEQVSLVSWSDDMRKIIVRVDSPTLGPAYALVDLDLKSARVLGNVYSGLTEDGLFEVRPIKYKAADGLEISGYLTLPRGKPAKNLPLIVLPHGGPEGRDEPGFDWWSQALASRGYAVLQPNFRGSEGFGWPFIEAGFGQWGKAMQTDLSDGVRDLVKQGIADPKRVCIVGASYGGYAALAGATIDHGVYRCAASVAGPSDLKRFLIDNNYAAGSDRNAATRYWLRFMGADGVRDPDLAAISPAKLAGKADIPVLLIHGKDDTIVPYVQSTIMADAMKKAGKPVELVTLPGEDHWLSRGATRLQMLNAVVSFVEKHNPPN